MYEFPADTLTEENKMALAAELTPLSAEGFMRDISDEEAYRQMFADVYGHAIGCERLSVYRDQESGEVLAFIAANTGTYQSLTLFHLGGIIVHSKMHRNGFAHQVLRREVEETGKGILAFHTQSQSMQGLGLKIAEFHSDLARDVAGLIGTGNLVDSPEGPIDAGRYGGASLYGDIKAFNPIAIKRPGFDYTKGDAIVFAGFVR